MRREHETDLRAYQKTAFAPGTEASSERRRSSKRRHSEVSIQQILAYLAGIVAIVVVAGGVWGHPSQAQGESRWELQVANVHDLYAVDATLSFDASVVEVIDADPERAGISILPGPLFTDQQPHFFVVYNRVTIDEEEDVGRIEFVATLLNPADPITGSGIIAIIPYRLLDGVPATEHPFAIEQARLASRSGHELLVQWEDNTIWQYFRTYLPLIARSESQTQTTSRSSFRFR